MTSRRNIVLAGLVAVVALVVAACSTPQPPVINEPPTITIQSPTDGSSSFSPVVLAATADDPEDGDLSTEIAWSSDVDGALTPAAGGEVALSAGAHTLTASVADSEGLTASASVAIQIVTPQATHVITEGLTVHLVHVDEGSLVETSSASIPADGLLSVHAIFNAVMHPTEPWLYTASMNDCGVGDIGCWGNGRIDRFVIENDSITHDGAAFLYDIDQVDIDCTQESVNVDYVGQVGYCAPIGMVFSPDATRFYVDDDDFDNIHVFAVDAAGDLQFLAEGASTDAHGLTIDPTGSYLYNGSNVISVITDTPIDTASGGGGNATAIVDLDGTMGLITTGATSAVYIYDLTDPTAPTTVDSLSVGGSQARDLDFDPSLSTIVTVGANGVHSVTFDGTTLTLLDSFTATEAFTTQYRGVELTAEADVAIAAWFTESGGAFTGGAQVFTIAADGTLDQVDSVDYDGRATTVLRVR